MAEVTGAPGASAGQANTRTFAPIPRVEFTDTDIRAVCKVVSDTTGLSIFVSPEVKARVGVWGRDIDPMELLRRAVDASGATYVVEGDAVNVMSWEEYQQRYGVEKAVVELQHLDPVKLAPVVQPFLSKQGKVVAEPQSGDLVIYDTAGALTEAKRVIALLDVPSAAPAIRVVQLHRASAQDLADKLKGLYPTGESAGSALSLFASAQSNSLVLRGSDQTVAQLAELARQLDQPRSVQVRNYQIVNLDAKEVYDNLLTHFGLAEGRQEKGEPRLAVSLGEQGNTIIVTGTQEDQDRIQEFLRQVDVPIREVPSGVRVYRLENSAPASVAQVISDLFLDTTEAGRTGAGVGRGVATTGSRGVSLRGVQYQPGTPKGETTAPATPSPPEQPTPGTAGQGAETPEAGVVAERPAVRSR